MRFIADFHIHSHYSRATSKEMNIVSLYKWGQIKGIQVIGTGDFTHPAWLNEMREKLQEAEPGLFTLKKEYADEIEPEVPASCRALFRFMLTVEISCIYSKGGKVRKVHCIVGAPSFAVAAKINNTLSKIGNLQADGRPILGLDSKELLKIVMDASPDCIFIPAHAWTPHFGVLGSSS
ncbi:MAG TPA: DNA helicase UvrD, partial [Candidatus Gracilibacteria bacterium]|nr:DNA helicase UvrD [Candidatus Gracilibacteria bacterium]